jgi:hypothetical protein
MLYTQHQDLRSVSYGYNPRSHVSTLHPRGPPISKRSTVQTPRPPTTACPQLRTALTPPQNASPVRISQPPNPHSYPRTHPPRHASAASYTPISRVLPHRRPRRGRRPERLVVILRLLLLLCSLLCLSPRFFLRCRVFPC